MTDYDSKKPFRIGLTGGIACGKSTVASMFAKLGVPVIDTDEIARELVVPGAPALAEITDSFGSQVIDSAGFLDRRALRNLVFADEAARLELQAILHPRIGAETRRQADLAGGLYQIVVVPLLVGSKLVDFVDRVLVVDCAKDDQVQRLLARDAETIKQARRILATQSSRTERLAIADDVIRNDQDINSTREQVTELDEKYRVLAKRPCRHERSPENL